MEEEKAAAYYDELTRKGEGAARFKRGLGFSSGDDQHDAVPQRGSAFVSSSSSFLSSFVRASSPTTVSKLEKESQLQSIQNKLKKKPEREVRVSERENVERDRDKHSRSRSRSRSRDRRRRRSRSIERRTRRSRSRSMSPRRDRSRSPRREGKSERRRRSGSSSPRESRRSERHGAREGKSKKGKNGAADYSRLIQGYDSMSAAERVKAKMKLQLAETAEKDPTKGPGWERFEFDKDAPLDDEEIEVAEDDASLMKHIGQSFRFSAIEAKREEQLKAAHDEAIFGTTASLSAKLDSEPEEENLEKDNNDNGAATGLLSEKVLSKQPGSWRDRVRKA
ncbi:rhodanese-like domain-containing protein 8 [Hibiscus syriacus]|uniref:Rhodanese-like domain-containing protein 8 n=1 Tax=Hibiscus syriacus TaxID=106335 RepID=A0A6A2YHQ3_HIBSY|nr:probable ATP-dependent RNA helicase DDX46 [Hibiscus syriacus]KAE8675517.1 rhodanese-like domain-containing protein 8 [Hibiscus syriacus]